MNKKYLLIMSIFLAMIFAAVCTFGSYQTAYAKAKTYEWKAAIWGGSRAMTKAAEWWAKEMEKQTNGRFKVKWGWGNVLSKQRDNLMGIKTGLFELAAFCPGFAPAALPAAELVELPFMGGTNLRYELRLETAMGTSPLLQKESEKRWNAKWLLSFGHPPYEFMGNKRFAKVEDLKGLRLRTPPLAGRVFEKFGGVRVATPTAEVYTAMERGMIDLAAYPWSYCFGAFKIYEVSKYATIGIDMGSYFCSLYVSKTAWDSLPADIKAVHEKLMKNYNNVYVEYNDKADKKWIPIFKKKGIEIITLPASEKAKLEKAAEPLYEKIIKEKEAKGIPAKKVFNYLKAVRKKVLAGEKP